MKTAELRNMAKEELISKQLSLKEELMNMRFKVRMGKLENPSSISRIRKDIARILTILKEGSYAKTEQEKNA